MHENEIISYRWRKKIEESIEEKEEIAGKREEIAGKREEKARNHYDTCKITRKKHKVWGLLIIEMLDKNQILK